MKSSKLIKTLSTFTSKEFKEFEKRANNSFNKSEKYLLFIKIISNSFPNFDEKKINKEVVFSQIYKKEKYVDIRIRELMSSLNKILREYLVYLQSTSNSFQYEMDLLKQYNSRKLDSLYDSQLKVVKSVLKKDEFKNKEFYRRSYLLASVENDHFSKQNIRALDGSIQTLVNNLDYFYFSTKLIETCEMLNRQMLLNQHYELNLFKEIEILINNNKDTYFTQPTIICYYEIYKLFLNDDNIDQFKNTIDVLKTHTQFFTDKELKAIFDFPQNYCIRNVNKGNDKYLEKLFDLQLYIVDKKFNLVNGFISHGSYKNIITIALKLKKFDWSKDFIENFREKVAPNMRENSYNFNKANYFFSVGKYEETLGVLNNVDFSDIYYASSSKTLMLKVYYLLGEFETLAYFITSFKLFLKRNKQLSINYKKGADLFLTYFKKVFNIAEKKDFYSQVKINSKLDLIKEGLHKETNIHNRAWLIEILESLQK
jgi:hypothetical protein